MTRNDYLDQILAKVTEVPTLPSSVLRVMNMIEDPLCSASDLAGVIMADPGMATKVLKLANSSYYGFRQKISSIPQAITLLGFATLKNALLSAAVFDLFRISGSGFDLIGLWKHSVSTATAAKIFAKKVRYPNAEKAYTAGLLHDIGKIMIARYLPTSLPAINKLILVDGFTMYEAEQRTVGLPHPAFGAWVMSRWNLPSVLIEAVEYHHYPTKAQHAFDLAAIVYLADILAHRTKLGNGGDNVERVIDPRVLEYFSINETHLCDMQEALQFKRLEIESFAAVAAAV
jgi:putative nucleotidyltransferase with HDIG domain